MNPVTRKRIRAFLRIRRARWSLCLLAALYFTSLFSNLIANDRPLLIRFEGNWFFPALVFYPEKRFVDDGANTRPDYRALSRSERFAEGSSNWMVWPLIPWGPNEAVEVSDIELDPIVRLVLRTEEQVGQVDVLPDGTIARSRGVGWAPWAARSANLFARPGGLPLGFREAIDQRLQNRSAPEQEWLLDDQEPPVLLRMGRFESRPNSPRSVRILLRKVQDAIGQTEARIHAESDWASGLAEQWPTLSSDEIQEMQERIALLLDSERYTDTLALSHYRVLELSLERVSFPFRPVRGHPMGLDSSGRDVLVRILYAARTSLNFGFLLVTVTLFSGILIGAVQGYYAGKIDLWGQRVIEVWESLPFLYILMLMGSVFGRSFMLLLFCYGIFNWVGISYYMRGEFLRLRRLPFVDAARVSGLSDRKIILKHILPNSLVPVITFFPFSLVGAIGVLASLDYLGFGLPPPTASWGELLAQAQEFSFAWWLVLYPTLALFAVILLGVFIGEGVREAYDPRRALRWEA